MLAPLLFFSSVLARAPQAADIEHAVSSFAHSLNLAVLAPPGKNALYSPYSVASCLSLLIPGVGRADEAKLASGLQLPTGSSFELDEAFRMLRTNLLVPGRSVMQGANSVWTGPGIELKSAYSREVGRAFGALAHQLRAVGPAGAQQVNDWVSQNTKGRIPHLFDALPRDARVVLVNALTFDGVWDTPFDPAKTAAQPFHGKRTLPTPMMADVRKLGYAESTEFSAVQIPYTGGRFRMVVFLPAPGVDALHVLRMLDLNALPTFTTCQVDLQFPKFQFSTTYDLTAALSRLGLGSFTHAFDASNMLNDRRPMVISQLMHAGFIQVDEQGTKAAAATGGVIRPTAVFAPPRKVTFHVDRPFAFLIMDGALPVFEGAVYDPSAE